MKKYRVQSQLDTVFSTKFSRNTFSDLSEAESYLEGLESLIEKCPHDYYHMEVSLTEVAVEKKTQNNKSKKE